MTSEYQPEAANAHVQDPSWDHRDNHLQGRGRSDPLIFGSFLRDHVEVTVLAGNNAVDRGVLSHTYGSMLRIF